MKISGIGKISQNLAETVMEVAVNTPSYRKAEANIEAMTNCSISHEGIRNKVIEIGNKIGKRRSFIHEEKSTGKRSKRNSSTI